MPIISFFFGIKIYLYGNEHNPPHIHAIYNEYKSIVEIESQKSKGNLPPKQLNIVIEWVRLHREELLLNWNYAQNNNNNEIFEIEPYKK